MNDRDLMNKYYKLKNEEYLKKNPDKNRNDKNLIPIDEINPNKRMGLLYTRVSTNYQVETGVSLDQQDLTLTKYCDGNNIQIIGKYCDAGISGYTVEHRPQMTALLEALQPGYVVVCAAVSRLSRNTAQLLEIYEKIAKKQCEIIVLDLQLDTSSPVGKLMLTMMASLAEFERSALKLKIKSTMEYLVEEDLLIKKPLYGWKREKGGELEEKEDEQIVIKMVRSIVEQNPTIKINALTTELNKKGFRNRKNNPFHPTTILAIVNNNHIPLQIKNQKSTSNDTNEMIDTPKNKLDQQNAVNNIEEIKSIIVEEPVPIQSPLPTPSFEDYKLFKKQQKEKEQYELFLKQYNESKKLVI